MKLYSYYRSVSAYRVRLALAIKGLAYDYVPVHLVKNGGEQHTPEYKALNPQSMVPTLQDGDLTITQSLAIIAYLDEKYPEPALLPKKLDARAYVRQIVQICASDMQPLSSLRVLNHLSGELSVTQAQKNEWYQKWAAQGFDAIETLICQSPHYKGQYVCGQELTLADICLIPQVYDARRYDMDLSSWPTIAAIDAACASLDVFNAACPENQPDTPEDQRPAFLKGKAT
jgi:maleylacetoacetate isomerase